MIITIYDRYGKSKAEVSPNDSSSQSNAIQSDNVLSLSFTYFEHILLDVDDYVDFKGERYWLCEKYRPKQKSTCEWEYDLKLYGIESLLRNILVIKRVDNENDPVFTLTAPPREHVAMIVNCLNDGMGNTNWKVGQVDGTDNIVIDYFGKYCDEALKEIAEKTGTEYWVEGQTVNVCRCEHGELINLGYDKGLTDIDPDIADNVKFYTRLYPVGSNRNIDPEKYGHSRLQLPDGKKYVEVNADKYGRVDHYEADAFADIYPRRVGTVSSVRSEVKKGEDGKDFTVWYFRDDDLSFNPNDYEIPGLVKRVSFQEGSDLAGLGDEEDGTYYFEVNYNAQTREFEIITIWPYDNDMQLPGGNLVPAKGDNYILWHLRMPDEYYDLAEKEFMAAVNKYNADHALDVSVYKASTDHVWIEDNDVDLFVGRRVRLESNEYFPDTGYRDSRITKITRKVNLPSQMDIEIGDAVGLTARAKMSYDISATRSYAQSIGASMSLPDIIRTWDRTVFTDNNLLSARRIDRDYLSKLKDDRSTGKIASDKGFEVGKYSAGISGGMFGIDNTDNQSFADVFKLYVRGKAYFETLTTIEATSLAGKRYITPGGSIKCTSVEEIKDNDDNVTAYRCYFLSEQDGEKTETKIIADDQAISEMFNAKTGVANGLSNHRYWRLVTAVDNDAHTDEAGNHYGYIELSATDCEVDSDVPQAGDVIDQLGNRKDPKRQSAIILSTVDADAPSIKMLMCIGSGDTSAEHYDLTDKDAISQGYDHLSDRAYFKCYGDHYFGARDKSSYVSYDSAAKRVILNNVALSLTSTIGEDSIDEFLNKRYGYLTKALVNDTEITNGLIQTSATIYGYRDATGQYKVLAGTNGLYDDTLKGKTIAAWWGGKMIDRQNAPEGADLSEAATTLFRMDGSGYFAKDAFSWDAQGNPTLGSGVRIDVNGNTDNTLASIINFQSHLAKLFILVDPDGKQLPWRDIDKAKSIGATKPFFSFGDISAFGDGTDGSTGGGTGGGISEAQLEAYLTNHGYATQEWVEDNYNDYTLTKAAVESVLTGDITSHTHSQYLTASSMASALSDYYTKTEVNQGFLHHHYIAVDSAIDANAVTDNGEYYIRTTALTNFPSAQQGTLLSFGSEYGRATQLYFTYGSGEAWYRTAGYSSTRGPWQRLLTDKNYATYLDDHYLTVAGEQTVTGRKSFLSLATNYADINNLLTFRKDGTATKGQYFEIADNGDLRINSTVNGAYSESLATLKPDGKWDLRAIYASQTIYAAGEVHSSEAVSTDGYVSVKSGQKIFLDDAKTVWIRFNPELGVIEASHTFASHGDVSAFIE